LGAVVFSPLKVDELVAVRVDDLEPYPGFSVEGDLDP
jgi:hypothetical protein